MRIVVYHQHSPPASPHRHDLRLPHRSRRGGDLREVQIEPEAAALIRFALDPEISSHEPHQPIRDRKTEPRALRGIDRVVHPVKDIEDLAEALGADPDPRVLDEESHAALVQADLERDPPALRVFDGVIDEIHEHLPKAPSVRPHRFGEIREIDARERQTLRFGPSTHRLGQAAQQLLEVELALLQLERARLDLGHIENVFNEPQEVFAGCLDDVQGLPLVH